MRLSRREAAQELIEACRDLEERCRTAGRDDLTATAAEAGVLAVGAADLFRAADTNDGRSSRHGSKPGGTIKSQELRTAARKRLDQADKLRGAIELRLAGPGVVTG